MIPQDFSIVFFFEGEQEGSICNSQCFQQLYLETRHGNVHGLFLTFLSKIVAFKLQSYRNCNLSCSAYKSKLSFCELCFKKRRNKCCRLCYKRLI